MIINIGGIFLICVVAGWAICGQIYRALLQRKVMDEPNDRSMHAAAVPRGGGLGLWLTILPFWIGLLIITGQWHFQLGVIAGTLLLIGVSWLDDEKPLSIGLRFGSHIFAVALALISFESEQLVFQGFLPLWLDRILTAFCWIWFINLTNFMDGIDGISSTQGVHTALAFILISAMAGLPVYTEIVLAAAIAGALLGFLKWNWHPAKMFMGDVGSVPLGYLLGFLMITLAMNGLLLIALCIPFYYLADATITLMRRIAQKRKFWQPHREHFYQKAALAIGNHAHVLRPIILANIGLMGIAAFSLKTRPEALLAVPLLVAGLLWYLSMLANTAKK
jgi:UDP-N-acetylmuramyl pentapeptide phosphotransferase/UDP-N-acetylglucosamine-1-phosphate transferase